MVKYIPQSFEIMSKVVGEDVLKLIEKAGRICYKSEGSIDKESYKRFIKSRVDGGHLSVIEHSSVTVKFVTNRGVTHEVVRHRVASYSQESTRYCDYSGEKQGAEINVCDVREFLSGQESINEWLEAMEDAERHYMNLIKLGNKPQLARGVLPTDLKTEIVMTANLREWGHVFALRTAPDAHPHMQALMKPLLVEFRTMFPVVFDDLKVFK